MINLTQFIGNKLHENIQPKPKQRKGLQQVSQSKKFQFGSIKNMSQRSLGLSTLLDLQNEEDFFGELRVSRIEGNTNRQKRTMKYREISETLDVKNEIEQMRERRRALQQKVNQTLRKQQYRSKGFELNQTSSVLSQHSTQNEKHSQFKQSRESIHKEEKSLKFREEQQESIEQYQMSKQSMSMTQSLRKTQNSKYYEPPCSYDGGLRQQLSKAYSLTCRNQDGFMKYLKKQIWTLKLQKFLSFISNFKFRFLLKHIKQQAQIHQIMQREQSKLSKFVFTSWKRQTKQSNQKSAMVQLIRKNIQQKKNQKKSKNTHQIQGLNKTKKTVHQYYTPIELINKQRINEDLPELKQAKESTNAQQILEPDLQKCEIINQALASYSQLNIQQVSPIKARFQVEDQPQKLNESSFYSKYSCFTEKEEEEYVK